MKNLIIDFANLSAIIRYGVLSKNSATLLMEDNEWENYFLDSILISLSNYINVLKADRVILPLESKSWRKTYYPLYKSNRDSKKEEDEKLDLYYSAINKAAEFMRDFTNAKVIKVDGAEGDDIIAVLAQKFSTEGDTTIIVSTDGDFKQLLKYKGIKIFNPIKKIFISNKYSHLEYITKLVKGDNSDNIPSSYPRIKKEILEKISSDEKLLEHEFKNVDKTIERQKYYIAKFLKIDSIPDDLTNEEWQEVLAIAREKKDKIKSLVKQEKLNNTYNNNEKLKEKEKHLKEILKLAKKENISEARLFNVIESFRDSFNRNKKLICLEINNIPEYITDNILNEYNKSHKHTKQSEFLKFARKHKLKEFAFSQEWKILKSIKDIK